METECRSVVARGWEKEWMGRKCLISTGKEGGLLWSDGHVVGLNRRRGFVLPPDCLFWCSSFCYMTITSINYFFKADGRVVDVCVARWAVAFTSRWLVQCFGHLMQRPDSLEKTLVLGKIEGRRRRGWQRIRWSGGITDSMDMSLNKLQGLVIEKPGILQFMGLQRDRHDLVTEQQQQRQIVPHFESTLTLLA